MKYILTVTRDKVMKQCQRAINLYENEEVAERAWGNGIKMILNQGNTEMIPINDLELYKIGEIDTETMEIKPCKEYICAGAQFAVNFVPTPRLVGNEPLMKDYEEINPEPTELNPEPKEVNPEPKVEE